MTSTARRRLLPSWSLNALLFFATVVSVLMAGAQWQSGKPPVGFIATLRAGISFALPLMMILVAHELKHYIATHQHKIPASLPYFIPLPTIGPIGSPFGTLGAVILMTRRIRSARALLDIGASGPLAGMVFAVPLMLFGLSLSKLEPRVLTGFQQEGQSLLYCGLKWLVFGHIPANYDVVLHPTALAAWVGFLVTFLNLVPFSQLDGGHVAYALLGSRHDRISRLLWLLPVTLCIYNAVVHAGPAISIGFRQGWAQVPESLAARAISATSLWSMLSVLLGVVTWSRGGTHPPVEEPGLDPVRRGIAWFTLALFVLLFMPSPLVAF